ncbi:Uncharacterized protein Adt_44100 [Abeliophyllum distichum]|uniref:Uncharacterized protein n=1 Tax=Abeliophyllum distichum TaxID=126358 RepID=A0ABD1P9W3_9LAMI
MSLKVNQGGPSGRIRDGTSPPISLSMADVLPIRGIDTSTGEEMAIASNSKLVERVWFGTDAACSKWMESDGRGLYLWFRHSFGQEMPLHVFQIVYQPRKLPKKKGKEEEFG